MFINPKSFFTSWAVQFIWLLEGPPREEIFPAALCTRAHGADSKPRGEQRFPMPLSLLQPATASQPLPSERDCTLGCGLAPQPPLCRHLLRRVFSSALQIAARSEWNIFLTRVEREKVLLGQRLAVSSQNPYIPNASAVEPFVVSPNLSRDGRMKSLLSEGVSPVSGVTDNMQKGAHTLCLLIMQEN